LKYALVETCNIVEKWAEVEAVLVTLVPNSIAWYFRHAVNTKVYFSEMIATSMQEQQRRAQMQTWIEIRYL